MKHAWYATALVVAVLSAGIVALVGPRLSRLWKLSQGSATTQGVVVSRPGAHGLVTYRYSVEGTNYTGAESVGYGDGETVTIYYSVTDPNVSALEDPQAALAESALGALILLGLVVLFGVWMALRWGD